MNKPNLEAYEKKVEKKAAKRQKKKKPKMKVSGGSVKRLQKIIINKS